MSPAAYLSAAGRLGPSEFATAAVLIYAAGLLSQALLSGAVVERLYLWPYAIAQASLLWMWFAVHAKRLRDGGRRIWPAVAVAVLYAVATVALGAMAATIMTMGEGQAAKAGASTVGVLGFFLVMYLLIALFTPVPAGSFALVAGGLLLLAYGPSLAALVVSIWAGTRPAAPPTAAPAVAA